MLDVSLGGEDLNGGYRGGTSFWALTRASGARVALGSSRDHEEHQEQCCRGLSPYMPWVPVKCYLVTRMEQPSWSKAWEGLGWGLWTGKV